MNNPGQTGQRFLRAVNIETGRIVWEVPQPGPAKAKTWSFSWDVFLNNLWESVVPLFFCSLIVLAALAFDHTHQLKFKYVVFFSIMIASALGLTKTLTGSHAESKNIILYGFSFLYCVNCLFNSLPAIKRECRFRRGSPGPMHFAPARYKVLRLCTASRAGANPPSPAMRHGGLGRTRL
jgi:hypothetical protein